MRQHLHRHAGFMRQRQSGGIGPVADHGDQVGGDAAIVHRRDQRCQIAAAPGDQHHQPRTRPHSNVHGGSLRPY